MRRFAVLFALVLVTAACGAAEEPFGGVDTVPPTEATVALVSADDSTATTHMDEHPEDDHGGDAMHDDEAMHEEGDEHDEAAHEEDGEDHTADGEFDRIVEVTMTEFAFEPAAIQVSAGETVRFVVANEGAIEHEFRMTTQHAAEEHIAAGHDDHGAEGEEGEHGHEEMLLLVAAGDTGTIDITFHEAGEYDVVACLLPGHFEAGMHGELEYGA